MSTNVNKNDEANKEVLADLQLLSKKEVANLLKVSTSTVDRYVKNGEIKFLKRGNNAMQGRVFFYLSDVLEFQNRGYGFK